MKLPIPVGTSLSSSKSNNTVATVSEAVTTSAKEILVDETDTANFIPQNQWFGHVTALLVGILIGRFIIPKGYFGMQKRRTF